MAETVQMEGLSKLLEAMRALPQIVEDKCVRKSMVPGAQMIRDAAKSIAVRRTGLTKIAVRIAFNQKESTTGKKIYHVFVSRRVKMVYPKGKGIGRTDKYAGKLIDPFYWHMIELGTVKKGARPFMRPAFDSTSRQAAGLIIRNLEESIDKEASTLGR